MTPRPSSDRGKSERDKSARDKPDGRFAYEGLDRAIHEKARLGILTSLTSHAEGLSFNDLKELCALTDGNLNRHLAVLADAGLIAIDKTHAKTRPQTMYRITPDGRRRFLEYISVLERVVADAMSRAERTEIKHDSGKQKSSKLSKGWSPA